MSTKPINFIKISSQKTMDSKRSQRSITTYDKSSSSGSRKYFDPQLQAFTRKKLFKFQNFLQKQSQQKQNLTFNEILQKLLYALQHFYSSYNDNIGFYSVCKQFLIKGWEIWKLKILQRFNTYQILSNVLKRKSYQYIQNQVIKQFKKNCLLYGIMTYWYDWIKKINFKNIQQFQQQYQLFRQFLSQITYLIFRGWFSSLQKKNNTQILNKLFEQSTHLIVTQFSQWNKIYQKILKPLIQKDLQNNKINWNYDMKQLNIKKFIVTDIQTNNNKLKQPNNLKQTIEILDKFSKQTKLSKKIQLLRDVRVTLQKQIIQNQRLLIDNRMQKSYQILQKQDFIISHIHCIIRGKLTQIQQSMKYLQILLGPDLQFLSKMQLNSYAIDIIAAIQLIVQKSTQFKQQQQDVIMINSLMENSINIQSKTSIGGRRVSSITSFGDITINNYKSLNQVKIKSSQISMKYMKVDDKCYQEEQDQ